MKELIPPGIRVVRGIRVERWWVTELAFGSRMPAVVAKIGFGPVSGRKRIEWSEAPCWWSGRRIRLAADPWLIRSGVVVEGI